MSDALRWYKTCCEEYIPGLESEPEFAHDQLMSLLVHDEEYNTQEVYQLDVDEDTSLQLTRFEFDGTHFYNLELLCQKTPQAVITFSAEDTDVVRSARGEVLAPYLSSVFGSRGLPDGYLDTLRSALSDPQNTFREDSSLEYRLTG